MMMEIGIARVAGCVYHGSGPATVTSKCARRTPWNIETESSAQRIEENRRESRRWGAVSNRHDRSERHEGIGGLETLIKEHGVGLKRIARPSS